MDPSLPQLIAGDTNIGLDLAQTDEWVLDALATIRRRLPQRELLIPPTVLDELGFLASEGEAPDERDAAGKFLREHRRWGFGLVTQIPLGATFVGQIAERLRVARLLPPEEVNDS